MSSWKRFQQLNGTIRKDSQAKVNTHFIFKGYPSIQITNAQDKTQSLQAVVVNQQTSEQAYIYTPKNHALSVGSVWGAKGLNWLIAEEIVTIKDVEWNKYHCFLANIEMDGLYGFFIGPEKSHINITLQKEVALISQQKPVLILAGMPLQFQDRIMIHNRAWIVDEYDSISTRGITYYSLLPTTMSKTAIDANADKEVFVEKHVEPVLELNSVNNTAYTQVSPGLIVTLSTQRGYFKSSVNTLQIVKRTSTEVQFIVPFGVNEFAVETRVNDYVVTKAYKVVV